MRSKRIPISLALICLTGVLGVVQLYLKAADTLPAQYSDSEFWRMVTDFSGLGENHAHRQAFAIDADHPEVFASEDNGATPVEIVLCALASCLTAGVATVATNRGIELRSVKTTIEGDMDLQGILGIDGDVRNGFDGVKATFEIDADCSRADKEAILAQSQKRSAVFDVVANPTTVRVELA